MKIERVIELLQIIADEVNVKRIIIQRFIADEKPLKLIFENHTLFWEYEGKKIVSDRMEKMSLDIVKELFDSKQ